MKRASLLFFIIIIFVLLASLMVYYFIFTNSGSTFIVKSAILKYTRSKSVDIKKSEGSLAGGLVFHDIEINDPKVILPGSLVRIQKLEVYFKSFNLEGINTKIHNGRTQLAGLGQVAFCGSLEKGNIDGNIYSKGFNVAGISNLFPKAKELKNASGLITDIDIYVKGKFTKLKFTGKFRIEKLFRDGFSLSNCPSFFDLELKNVNKYPKLNGTITLNSGAASGAKTALINIEKSEIAFFEGFKEAFLNLKGTSKVEGTRINILLKGTFNKPELKLISNPPLSQERLLIMLMTGKSWKATEAALYKREFSPDLVKDFLDYFIFSSPSNELVRHLGISDVFVTFEQQKKGLSVKKAITEKINASYAVEKTGGEQKMPATTQRVGGEYKITECLYVGAEKELKQDNKSETTEEQKANDKVSVRFKKNF